jgi:hypothetical protein
MRFIASVQVRRDLLHGGDPGRELIVGELAEVALKEARQIPVYFRLTAVSIACHRRRKSTGCGAMRTAENAYSISI